MTYDRDLKWGRIGAIGVGIANLIAAFSNFWEHNWFVGGAALLWAFCSVVWLSQIKGNQITRDQARLVAAILNCSGARACHPHTTGRLPLPFCTTWTPRRRLDANRNIHVPMRRSTSSRKPRRYPVMCSSAPSTSCRIPRTPRPPRNAGTEAAPIVRRFIGQRLGNLMRFAERCGNAKLELLP